MHTRHEIHVSVVSPEEAGHGVAEFWVGGELFGFTRLEDGELVLRIEPRSDGSAALVNAHSLAAALARAKQLLESY
jgi:hypothetical protein